MENNGDTSQNKNDSFSSEKKIRLELLEGGRGERVESFHEELRKLRRAMLDDGFNADNVFFRNVRPYRQQFCLIARTYGGLSHEELCRRLNKHEDILYLNSKTYPCFHLFYPITPQFISDLETNISNIFEYCRSGLAFGGLGVPTDIVAKTVAKICGVADHYEDFQKWSMEYQHGKSRW